MGEYATYQGRSIKIGTCENMYYLRADQAAAVTPERGSLDPVAEREAIRFRFPWPDEDGQEPGSFERHSRHLGLYNVAVPAEVEHTIVQFVASVGYNVCLPCPESVEELRAFEIRDGHGVGEHRLTIHRNGFAGPVRLVQQAWRDGLLVGILECGGCGMPYRLPTLEDAQPVLDELERHAAYLEHQHSIGPYADQGPDGAVEWHREVARRLAAGYAVTAGQLAG